MQEDRTRPSRRRRSRRNPLAQSDAALRACGSDWSSARPPSWGTCGDEVAASKIKCWGVVTLVGV
ncbi:hypothetical protein ACFPRL_11605 [Pseudoclavibacter helvolus]